MAEVIENNLLGFVREWNRRLCPAVGTGGCVIRICKENLAQNFRYGELFLNAFCILPVLELHNSMIHVLRQHYCSPKPNFWAKVRSCAQFFKFGESFFIKKVFLLVIFIDNCNIYSVMSTTVSSYPLLSWNFEQQHIISLNISRMITDHLIIPVHPNNHEAYNYEVSAFSGVLQKSMRVVRVLSGN